MKLLILVSLVISAVCGAPQPIRPYIINGFPLAVQHACAVFAQISDDGSGYFGGGSIISERHILTGANVLFGASACVVGYGGTQLSALPFVTNANTFITHPRFNRSNLANDIGIIFMPSASRIVFSETVRAILLPTAAAPTTVAGSIAGFGYTRSNDIAFSDQLLVANLTATDIATCNTRFNMEFTTHICALGGAGPSPSLISNTCPGDNGAVFYTGDHFITTTTPPPTTETEEITDTEETTDPLAATVAIANDYYVLDSNRDPDTPKKRDTANELQPLEQVEPVAIGIASAIGDFWVCNADDPRAYTDVFMLVDWILDVTGL